MTGQQLCLRACTRTAGLPTNQHSFWIHRSAISILKRSHAISSSPHSSCCAPVACLHNPVALREQCAMRATAKDKQLEPSGGKELSDDAGCSDAQKQPVRSGGVHSSTGSRTSTSSSSRTSRTSSSSRNSGSSSSSSKQNDSLGSQGPQPGAPLRIDDPQLLVGDCVALVSAALYRQIAAIALSPSFPGWLAPLHFNPLRFAEFANFASMLVASWLVAATLTGGYSAAAVGTGVPGALRAVSKAWLVSMPVCAAHLVLVTASESQALVGEDGFADALPLAAAGTGEPLGTAAAVLGLMAMWRSFYAVYLDHWAWASPRDLSQDAADFRESLATAALLAAGCGLVLQVLQLAHRLGEAAAAGTSWQQALLGYS